MKSIKYFAYFAPLRIRNIYRQDAKNPKVSSDIKDNFAYFAPLRLTNKNYILNLAHFASSR